MGDSPMEDFFAQYEDLAVAVIDDRRPNADVGISLCNAEMAETVCRIMNWEWFSIFDEHPYATAYESTVPPIILAHCYIAFLRWNLWISSIQQNIGDQDFNDKACAYDELWYLKLRDHYIATVHGKETKHSWLQ